MAESTFRFGLSHVDAGTQEIEAPEDWADMQHTIARDAAYHGITIKYSVDFTFVKDGFDFIRSVYNTFGVEAEILFIIYELNVNEHKYDAAYTGRINLAKYVSTEENCSTNAEESGFTRRVLNLEDVEIDLHKLVSVDGEPMGAFDDESISIALHSKAIVKRYEGYVSATQPEYDFRPLTRYEDYFGTLYVGFDDEKVNELNIYNYNTGLELGDGRDELVEFKERGLITVDYSLNVFVECLKASGSGNGDFDAATVNFYLGLNLPPDTTVNTPLGPRIIRGNPTSIYHWNNREAYGLNDDINGDFGHTINITGTHTFNVNIGDKLYFYGDVQIYDISEPLFGDTDFEWRINANAGSYLKIRGATTTDPTPANAVMIHEAYARVVQAITGRDDAFYSELLGRTDSQPTAYAADGELSLIALTNGSQIRGFPLAERPIFAQLKELYNSTNAIKPIGIGTELMPDGRERIRLEGVEHFYRHETVLQLGMVTDLKTSVAQEYYYLTTDVGYKRWGSNADNSLDETNTKQTRLLPMKEIPGKYTAVSDYVASGYLIEQTRRDQYDKSPDKEGNEDKTNFWICVVRKTVGAFRYFEPERNQNLTVCNNVLSPDTIYNIRITPQRNWERHGRLINSCLIHREMRNIVFQEGNANYTAETKFTGETVSTIENETITAAQLLAPLWIPEYYEFEHPLRLFQRKLIEANPYGVITFMNSKGETLKGYLKEIKVSITERNAAFKLLRANI